MSFTKRLIKGSKIIGVVLGTLTILLDLFLFEVISDGSFIKLMLASIFVVVCNNKEAE